jgi:hypothetical protein
LLFGRVLSFSFLTVCVTPSREAIQICRQHHRAGHTNRTTMRLDTTGITTTCRVVASARFVLTIGGRIMARASVLTRFGRPV